MSGLKKNNLYKDERGLVSILVVTILTVTLSLVAIGFSKLADRELRQASDRESSAQAYYAAQSGLNDAIAYLAHGGSSFTGCANWPPLGDNYFKQDISNGTGEAKYSCISVDNTPDYLSVPVTPGKPQVLKVSASGLDNLFIAWDNARYSGPPQPLLASGQLLPEDQVPADTTGILRVGIYGIPPGSSTNNATMSGFSRVYYLYPNSGDGTIDCGTGNACVSYRPAAGNYNVANGPGGNNGSFVKGNCRFSSKPNPGGSTQADLHYCNSKITDLSTGPSNTFYLYLTAQYAPLSVTIQGKDNTGKNVNFVSSQATVDVTGQGAGVIQRIRAIVNLGSQFDLPNYAIQSMESICKNFSINVPGGGNYGPATNNDTYDGACSAPAGGGPIIGSGGSGTGGH